MFVYLYVRRITHVTIMIILAFLALLGYFGKSVLYRNINSFFKFLYILKEKSTIKSIVLHCLVHVLVSQLHFLASNNT